MRPDPATLFDDALLAEWVKLEPGDGDSAWADALAAEIEKRNLDI